MAINPISFAGYAPGLPTQAAPLAQGSSTATIADQNATNVDVNFPRAVRTITAQSGDLYRVATLFQSQGSTSNLTYTVVTRGGGSLQLDGATVDQTTKTSFTADEFSRLAFSAGTSDSDIAVVANNGSTSSDALQITAKAGTTRSLDALPALYSSDPLALIAFGANLTAGTNTSIQPKLTVAGNFTSLDGDTYRVASLVKASAPSGASISAYNIGVRGGGTLTLDGTAIDPNTKTAFTPDEFERLVFQAGSSASDFVVSATSSGGASAPAVGFTASVGTSDVDRTINAEPARYSVGSYGMVGFSASITQSPTKGASPTLSTVGDFQAESGEAYRVATLYSAKAGSSGAVSNYLVAVKGGGQLLLDGKVIDPDSQTSFSADEFARLQFKAGSTDSKLVVAAQAKGISSQAIEVTAETASETSFNALAAKYNSDSYSLIAFSANLLNPSGSAANAPKLTSVGNFTGSASDTYRVANLFKATGTGISSYNVATRGTGTLTLDGATVDQTTKTSFTEDEYNRLVFVPGAGKADIVASAQTGSTSSPAVQISASIGNRSINVATAAYTQDYFSLVGYSAALTNAYGSSSGSPGLATVGNFSAEDGQKYRIATLYKGEKGTSNITNYNVALRGDGSITLDGNVIDTSTKSSFTADEFNRLVFTAGSGSSDLVVAATDGSRSSQALQITATTTGTTSLNAGAAAYASDAFLLTAFSANLLRGSQPNSRPQFAVTGSLSDPSLSAANASASIGAYLLSGVSSLGDGNEIGIADLFGATATGGVVQIGARAAGNPTVTEVLAEANSGIGNTVSSNSSSRGAAYGVQAYNVAGKLG
jgi:hypothetical protein